jgi:hypothetical protein
MIVHPGHTEENGALRLNQTANNVLLLQTGILFYNGNQSLQNLVYCLQELGLLSIASCQVLIDAIEISVIDCHNEKHPFMVFY